MLCGSPNPKTGREDRGGAQPIIARWKSHKEDRAGSQFRPAGPGLNSSSMRCYYDVGKVCCLPSDPPGVRIRVGLPLLFALPTQPNVKIDAPHAAVSPATAAIPNVPFGRVAPA